DAGGIALLKQRDERLRDEPWPERVCAESALEDFRGDGEGVFVFIEGDAGVIHEDVEAIGVAGEFLGRAADAGGIGDVEFQEGDVTVGAELLGGSAAGLCIARAEKDVEAVPAHLPDNLEADAFVCAGDEGDSLILHGA
ncbi:MAG TPA: hypothetical protein VF846_10240, partial [Thermoanaerobaculia bacterium]